MKKQNNKKILIVDDFELNRAILCEMFCRDYEVIEAEGGRQAIEILKKEGTNIKALLLDIVMPDIDGFGVLDFLSEQNMIEKLPVFLITAETAVDTIMRGFEKGVVDVINKPINDPAIICKRVYNAIELYQKRSNLECLVEEQVQTIRKQNENLQTTKTSIIDMLSSVIEFRSGESGEHVRRIRKATKILLENMAEICPEYNLSEEWIILVSGAATMHDIGKVSVPDYILNKPGRLTKEEFDEMKKHTIYGSDMLKSIPFFTEDPIFQHAYEICRHHHERWDGKGYPDGLKGNQIPIWAQVVALADVYEALTGERVYKPVYSHEKALSMIVNGECGQFNPELLNCFLEEIDNLLMELRQPEKQLAPPSLPVSSKPVASQSETLSERTLRLLELERQKYRVLSDLSGDITFDYDAQTDLLTFSEKYTEMFGGSFQMQDALKVIENTDKILKEDKPIIWKVLKELTPEQPVGKMELRMQTLAGDFEWFEVLINALWRNEKEPECVSLIGKMTNINDQKLETSRLKRQASTDSLTGTYNRKAAVELISDYLLSEPMPQGALFFMDIDDFKSFNDDYGHQYGDKILQKIGEKLRGAFRGTDIVGRIGGDEFIVFLEEISSREAIIRKAREVCGMFRKVGDEIGSPREITGSVGVACSPDDGLSFDSLLAKADQALYHAKKCGKNQFSFSTDLSKQ